MTQPLSRIGRYTIEREIGRGGFAVVYKAHDEVLGQTVALKLLRTELLDNKALVERFIREAQLLLNLKHANIVPLYNIDRADTGAYYLVMEFAAGGTLKAYIAERKAAGALPTPAQTAHVISQVADALDAAHARGLLHRDVKASNVLLQSLGEPALPGGAPRIEHAFLADFGLAKVARRTDNSVDFTMTERDGFGNTAGTLGYIAPEMLDFSSTATIDAKADQYSLAVVAFEMLTGRLPFEATPDQSPFVIVDPIVRRPAPTVREINPALPAEIGAAITRALAKDPGARFGSCDEFAAALRGEVEAATSRLLTNADVAISRALGENDLETAQTVLDQSLGLDPELVGLRGFREKIDAQALAWARFQEVSAAYTAASKELERLRVAYPQFLVGADVEVPLSNQPAGAKPVLPPVKELPRGGSRDAPNGGSDGGRRRFGFRRKSDPRAGGDVRVSTRDARTRSLVSPRQQSGQAVDKAPVKQNDTGLVPAMISGSADPVPSAGVVAGRAESAGVALAAVGKTPRGLRPWQVASIFGVLASVVVGLPAGNVSVMAVTLVAAWLVTYVLAGGFRRATK